MVEEVDNSTTITTAITRMTTAMMVEGISLATEALEAGIKVDEAAAVAEEAPATIPTTTTPTTDGTTTPVTADREGEQGREAQASATADEATPTDEIEALVADAAEVVGIEEAVPSLTKA